MAQIYPDTTAILLIDHQRTMVGTLPEEARTLLTHHLNVLTRMAVALNLPVVVTTNLEAGALGPSLPVICENLATAHEARIRRKGVLNAFDDPDFGTAVAATGAKALLIAGFPTDIAVAFAATRAAEIGYNVHALLDASASPHPVAEATAIRRMERAGVTPNATVPAMAEIAQDFSSPRGLAMMKVVAEQIIFKVDGPAV